jgi:hypothetical protein
MRVKPTSWLLAVFVILASLAGSSFANPQASSSQSSAASAASVAKPSPSTAAAASASDIADAKANHKVWVNLDTGIYHKGGRWYGKTKNGKFMTEDDATKAGYKAAKRD